MERKVLLDELQPIFREVFKRPTLTVEEHFTAEDVDGWDSLNHAILIDLIEQKQKVKFELMDMLKISSVGDIIDIILVKQNG